MAPSLDQVEQLERLASLRERGLLSEEEFQEAKRGLLDGKNEQSPLAASAGGFKTGHWLATGAAALAAVVLVGALVTGRTSANADIQEPLSPPTVEPAELAQAEPQPEASFCGSQATYTQIKDMVFEKAIESYGGDPVPLNSLKRAVSARMEFPVVAGVDEELQRTDCSGRLVIDLPPGMREQFDGEKSLEADVEYSSQPSADGTGSIIRVEGFGHVITRLVTAASLIRATRLASAGGPQLQRTFNPGFDCGTKLSNVERMICQDEVLAGADRAVSDKYLDLKALLTGADQRLLLATQRSFLSKRGQEAAAK
jgi:hypothetical protein